MHGLGVGDGGVLVVGAHDDQGGDADAGSAGRGSRGGRRGRAGPPRRPRGSVAVIMRWTWALTSASAYGATIFSSTSSAYPRMPSRSSRSAMALRARRPSGVSARGEGVGEDQAPDAVAGTGGSTPWRSGRPWRGPPRTHARDPQFVQQRLDVLGERSKRGDAAGPRGSCRSRAGRGRSPGGRRRTPRSAGPHRVVEGVAVDQDQRRGTGRVCVPFVLVCEEGGHGTTLGRPDSSVQ